MNLDETYFKTYRKIFENVIWTNPLELRLFLWLLGHAVFDPDGHKIGGIKIKRGQYLRSYSKLIEDLAYIENRQVMHYSKSQIHRAIKKLVFLQNITVSETELGTLFTVLNYGKYQPLRAKNDLFDDSDESAKDELGTEHGTTDERPMNYNNKEVRKKKNKYAVENLPPGLNGQLFLKTKFFYVTGSLKNELREKLLLKLSDEEMKIQFNRMETWLAANPPKKNYEQFFMNWFDKEQYRKDRRENLAEGSQIPAAHTYLI